MESDGFDTRRRQGLGAFVTQEDLAKHNYPDLTSIIAGVRGLHVEYGTRGMPMPYLRGIHDTKGAGMNCIPNYFIDGAPFFVDSPGPGGAHPYSDLSAIVRPETIRGIEVYSNPASVPAQYDRTSSTGCGSIVIWTQ